MVILALRTDKPEVEIGLFNDKQQLAYDTWSAHRQLAETIHLKIADILKSQNKDWSDIQAIVCYKGPGSFTGLRIGLSVANALTYSLKMPIVGTTGRDWIKLGIKDLLAGTNQQTVMPEYGAEVHVTMPKT